MEALYHQTNRHIQEVQDSLGRYEKANSSDVHSVEQEIQGRIDRIDSNLEKLDILVNKEPPNRRANAKLKVDQLKYDLGHILSAKRGIQNRRYQTEEEENERAALLSRRFTTNDAETTIQMDASLQHNQNLANANREMDHMIFNGSAIIGNLRDQRDTLKGAHKKILDVANTLGLSNTVMRLIERRAYQDKFILFGGMLVTVIIMWLVWKYFS